MQSSQPNSPDDLVAAIGGLSRFNLCSKNRPRAPPRGCCGPVENCSSGQPPPLTGIDRIGGLCWAIKPRTGRFIWRELDTVGGITLCMATRMDTGGDITLPHGRPAKGRPSATVCAQPAPGKPTCSMPGNRPLAPLGAPGSPAFQARSRCCPNSFRLYEGIQCVAWPEQRITFVHVTWFDSQYL